MTCVAEKIVLGRREPMKIQIVIDDGVPRAPKKGEFFRHSFPVKGIREADHDWNDVTDGRQIVLLVDVEVPKEAISFAYRFTYPTARSEHLDLIPLPRSKFVKKWQFLMKAPNGTFYLSRPCLDAQEATHLHNNDVVERIDRTMIEVEEEAE
jgi:hypothetical protein